MNGRAGCTGPSGADRAGAEGSTASPLGPDGMIAGHPGASHVARTPSDRSATRCSPEGDPQTPGGLREWFTDPVTGQPTPTGPDRRAMASPYAREHWGLFGSEDLYLAVDAHAARYRTSPVSQLVEDPIPAAPEQPQQEKGDRRV